MTLIKRHTARILKVCMSVLFLFTALVSFAGDDIYPDKPNPPRLVNDYAGILNSGEESRLERKLEEFARTTSTQISIVTITNLGGHDVAEYTTRLFNKWGIGQAGKNNGVLMLVAVEDRKAFIATGTGLQGVLTDAKTSRIFRNELRPAFREGQYAKGLDKAADAIIAVTKGEYTADGTEGSGSGNGIPAGVIVFIIFIILVIIIKSRGGGGGGGYMSRGGAGDFATGWLIGSLLNRGRGGWGGGNDWGGGGGGDWGGGGGFGGFGGGGTDGGGAGGSW